jgi:hypothetical protein
MSTKNHATINPFSVKTDLTVGTLDSGVPIVAEYGINETTPGTVHADTGDWTITADPGAVVLVSNDGAIELSVSQLAALRALLQSDAVDRIIECARAVCTPIGKTPARKAITA